MTRTRRTVRYLVAGFGHRGTFAARNPAGAVAQFRRRFRVSSRGWHGLTVTVEGA